MLSSLRTPARARKVDRWGSLVSAPIDKLLAGLDWTPMPPPEETSCGLVATHEAVLKIGGARLRCYALSDGQRVFDAGDVERFFGLEDTDASSSTYGTGAGTDTTQT